MTPGNHPPKATLTARRSSTDPATVHAIITRYQAGETAPTIAAALNISHDTVRRYLHRNRIPTRDDRTGKGPQTLADRIAALGTTTRAIRAWARATGHPVPAAGQVPAATIDAYQQAHQQEGTP
jgi:predicted transcriptional regulator